MAKRRLRRPTEDRALGRIMRQHKRSQERDDLLRVRRRIIDEDGTRWIIYVNHQYREMSTEDLRNGWKVRAPEMLFITFLEKDGVIYRKEEINNAW